MNKDEREIMAKIDTTIEVIGRVEASVRFKALGLGYRYLVAQSGVALGSIYKYMKGEMKPGAVRNRVDDALCRVLMVDRIQHPASERGGGIEVCLSMNQMILGEN